MKLRYVLIALAATAFICWNKQQYNRSFDHCEQLLEEIHRNQDTLKREIVLLQVAMSGAEVDDVE